MCYKRYYEYKTYKFNTINAFYFCAHCLCLPHIASLRLTIIPAEHRDRSPIIQDKELGFC